MSALTNQAILQEFLEDPDVSLTFMNHPLANAPVFSQSARYQSITSLNVIYIVAFSWFTRAIVQTLFKERHEGVKKQLLFYGVDYKHIYISSYFTDVLYHLIMGAVFAGAIRPRGFFFFRVEGLWLPLLLFSFAQPLFIYFTLSATSQSRSQAYGQTLVTGQVMVGVVGGLVVAFSGVLSDA